jgi:type II secretory pathway pseudopilin PulG
MKRFLFVLVLILIAGAYVAGYLPEHTRLGAAQADLRAAQAQLADAQNRVRLYALESRLTRMIETVGEKNYGDAAKLSSDFFDAVRAESSASQDDKTKSALEAILVLRDSVTSKLAMGDASVLDMLRQTMSQLRQLTEASAASSPTQ